MNPIPVLALPTATTCEQVILALGDFMNVQCHACIGGKSIGEDIRRLDYGVQVGGLRTGPFFVNPVLEIGSCESSL